MNTQFHLSCFLFGMCLCLWACTAPPSSPETDPSLRQAIPIPLNPNEVPESYDLSNLLESVRYIPLETRPDMWIEFPYKVKMDQHFIFVLDVKRNAVLVFDHSGKAVGPLGRHGKGPGEFGSPLDIWENPYTGTLDLNSSSNPPKIIQHDRQTLQFVHEIELPSRVDGFFPLNDSTYVVQKSAYAFSKDLAYHVLYLSQRDGHVMNRFLPYSQSFEPQEEPQFKPYHRFSRYAGGVSMVYWNSPAIYQLSDTGVSAKYAFAFEGREFVHGEGMYSRKVVEKEIYKTGKVCCPNAVTETANYVFFLYRYRDWRGITAVYSKKSGKVIQFRDYLNTFNDLNFEYPHGNFGEELIFIAYPMDILDKLESPAPYLQPQEAARLRALGDSLDRYDNPVLVLYKLRDF